MMTGGEISLPWPDRTLHPNARVHHMKLAAAKKLARNDAYWLARKVGIRPPESGPIVLTIGFHMPDNRRRDVDGLFSSMKSALDGIADAMGVDDRRFGFVLSREDQIPGGKVTIKVQWRAE